MYSLLKFYITKCNIVFTKSKIILKNMHQVLDQNVTSCKFLKEKILKSDIKKLLFQTKVIHNKCKECLHCPKD